MYNPEQIKNLFTLATYSIAGTQKMPLFFVAQECASFPGLRRSFRKLRHMADPNYLRIEKEEGKDPTIQFISRNPDIDPLRLTIVDTLIKVFRNPKTQSNYERLQDDFVVMMEDFFGFSVFGPFDATGTDVTMIIQIEETRIKLTGQLPAIYFDILKYAQKSKNLTDFYSGFGKALSQYQPESDKSPVSVGSDVGGFATQYTENS